jgi:hypothetical protein
MNGMDRHMKSDIALAVGKALFPMLSKLQEVGQLPLRAVRQIETEGYLERIILDFDSLFLIVSVDPDSDSVDFEIVYSTETNKTSGIDVSGRDPWSNFIDEPFGWGWVTVNQQGYCDGLLLSFKGIFPQVLLNVAASSIKAGLIDYISQPSKQLGSAELDCASERDQGGRA